MKKQMRKRLLYNGIPLPEIWPPEYPRSHYTERRVLPVPYLENPLEVILLGRGRELFVDDFLIASHSCVRKFHYPEKYADNPVLKPETALELGMGKHPSCACPKSGGVWFNYEKRIFQMWYEAGFLGTICYAESDDGLHWKRPDLDIVSGTNRVLPYGLKCDSWTVVHDYYTADPDQRFKMFLMEESPSVSRGMVMTSPDGIHWSLPIATGYTGDRSTMFYNPFTRKWCFSLRSYDYEPLLRMRDYAEGDDIFTASQWGNPAAEGMEKRSVHWAGVDELDHPLPELGIPPQLYNLDAVPYESIMLGLFQLHYGPSNQDCAKSGMPKITGLEFAYSRDGFHWWRPDRNCAILPEAKSSWDRGYVQSLGNVCTVGEEKITFYFTGFAGNPGGGWKLSMYENGATGVAFLRRDGFVSLDAEESGEIVTRKLIFDGGYLFVNLDAPNGSLKVELLDAGGSVIDGFAAEDCPAVSGDHVKKQIKWKNAELFRLSGQQVRFRFLLTCCRIYSFWVSKNPGGESNGFLAGGGPDYRGPIDLTDRSSCDSCR